MRIRNGGHHLSAGLGAATALLLYSRHAIIFCLVVFVAGVIVGRAWALWTVWADALRHKWHLARREPIATTPQPVYGRRGPTDKIPF